MAMIHLSLAALPCLILIPQRLSVIPLPRLIFPSLLCHVCSIPSLSHQTIGVTKFRAVVNIPVPSRTTLSTRPVAAGPLTRNGRFLLRPPFPVSVPRSLFPVPVPHPKSSFPVPRFPFPVPRSPSPPFPY